MIFVNKGENPLTPTQLEKRAQKYIGLAFNAQQREKSIRTADGAFDTFMTQFSLDHDVNVANNTFNQQLTDYRKAESRLNQYIVLNGREEVREMQPTGEQVINETTGELEDVMAEVVVQTAIDPVPEFVDVVSVDENGVETTETVRNPLVVQDEAERAEAQAVVDATPQEVKDY